MPRSTYAKEFLAKLSGAWGNREFTESVSRATSASIQNELFDGGAGAAPWDDAHDVPQLAQDATVLSFMMERISNEAGPGAGLPEVAATNAQRLAKLWESLSKICPPDAQRMFALNAACAYELAGYQANARCMAKRADAGASRGEKSGLQDIVGVFLQRKFVQMRAQCEPITREPDYDKVENIRYSLAMASAAAGLSSFAGHMLSGSSPEMGAIVEDLDDAEKLFHESGFHAESSLAHAARSILGSMWSRSTWHRLGGQAGGGFAWERYLVLLSRGLGTPVPSGSSISEVWPSQLEAVRRGLLSSNESKIVRMPTSTGKTRIAEMSILHALTTGPAGGAPRRCVYVAPYRALVSEVTRSLSLVFPDLGFSVSGMDGAYDATPLDTDGDGRPDILVLTPEKLDMLARTSPDSLDGIALFVVDEGHTVGHGARGVRIEMLLTRLRRRFAKSRFIVLSAMLSDDAMQKFATWLRCGGAAHDGDGIITTDWRPTLQRMAKLVWMPGGCRLVYEPPGINLQQRETVKDPIITREFRYTDAKTRRERTRMFPGPQKGEIAAELAFRYSTLGPVLVYTTSPRNVMSVARKLLDRALLHRGTVDGAPLLRDRDRRSADVSSEWLGPDHAVTRLLRSGIAVHHGILPHALRQAIESDVSDGEIGIMVATNTLSQGVSLPVRTIIVHSCRRHDEKGGRMERIPDGEYWNLAGRAGRAGHETEGTVIHIVMTPLDARDFAHYASVRGKHDDADSSLRRLLADLAGDRISDDDLARVMDPEILGIMAEEGARDGYEDIVRNVVVDSLAAQGQEVDPNIEKAFNRIESRARSIGADAPEPADGVMLRAYGGTGLGMQSCAIIQEYVDENRDALLALLAPESAGRARDLAAMIMGALGGVLEMDGELEYSGDRDGLLEAWMGGSTVHAALEKTGAGGKDADSAARFVGTAFGHYVPWGISAFVRIAAARLGIDEGNLPDHVRYLPEMVRHGVPAPEHSWAMRFGVPTKQAAILVCERLRPSTPRELARMMSGTGAELLAEHGIAAGAAAGVAGAARRMDVNPLLREGRSLEEVVREPARIVGTGGDQWYASRLAEGDHVEIRRDYGDLADRNALAAYAAGRHVGRVERRVAQYLAPLVDAGMKVSSRVASVEQGEGGAPPRIKVRLSAGAGAEDGRRRPGPAKAA